MHTATILTATAETFDALVLGGTGPVVVEFMSYGCSHCRTIEPVVARAAVRLGGEASFFRVNVGIDATLAETYGIEATPTFVMFLDGKERGREAGTHPVLEDVIAAVRQPFEGLRAAT